LLDCLSAKTEQPTVQSELSTQFIFVNFNIHNHTVVNKQETSLIITVSYYEMQPAQ